MMCIALLMVNHPPNQREEKAAIHENAWNRFSCHDVVKLHAVLDSTCVDRTFSMGTFVLSICSEDFLAKLAAGPPNGLQLLQTDNFSYTFVGEYSAPPGVAICSPAMPGEFPVMYYH